MNHIVTIIDKPIYQDGLLLSDRTAQITFVSPAGVILRREDYGCWDREAVMDQLRQGGCVTLDNLYIRDFSLSDARKTDYDRVRLVNFSARRAFFDGNTDFSISEFVGESVSFREAVFTGTTTDFRDARFRCGHFDFSKTELNLRNIYFNDSLFQQTQLDFSGMIVRSGDFHFFRVRVQEGSLNFSAAHFSDGFKDFRKIQVHRGNLIFRNAFFNDGDTDFIETTLDTGRIDFRMARFGSGELNFGGSRLGDGEKDFSGVIFPRGMVSFTGSHFGKGSIHIIDAVFRKGNIHFNGCVFESEDIHITGTDFGDGYLDFSDSDFHCIVFNIVSCRFGRGDIEFNRCNLSRTEVSIYGTEFSQGKLNFFDAKAGSVTFHECTFDNHVYLNYERCEHLNLLNCIVEKTVDLRNRYAHLGQNILVLNLSGTKNLGHIYLDWHQNQVKSLIYSQGKSTDIMDKACQFRLLKENFRDIGQYDDEDLAYVEFKRCQREGRYQQRLAVLNGPDVPGITRAIGHFYAWLLETLNWLVFDNIGRYGTSPRSVFAAMVQTIILFSLIYLSPSIKLASTTMFAGSEDHFTNKMMQGIYQSIQTFLTIGYGQVNPGNFTAVLVSGLEGFIGVFLMAYFTVSVVRKLLR